MLHNSIAPAAANYDAVVIGTGLGGLTAANRLARAGHQVLLLEHHHQVGGLATWFKRRGHIFDVSLHGFPYGMVKTCRKYWNREIMDSIVQLKGIVFDNPQFKLTTSFDRQDFSALLTNHFQVPNQVVTAFFNRVTAMNFYDDRTVTTRELFEEFFPGRSDVHRLLMEPITYANGSTLDDPAITYGIVFANFMNKGVFTFQGGTDRLIGLMVEELVKNGVTICTNAKAERIVIDQGRVRGVMVGDRLIDAKCVISNSGIINTVNHLAGRDHFPADFLVEADQVTLSNSSCQVYMGVRQGETLPDIGDLLFVSRAAAFDTNEMLDLHTSSRTFSLYYPKTRPGANQYTVVASMNARHDDWASLPAERYQTEKVALIDRAVDHLETYLPGIRQKCDWLEAATPKTFQRYTLHLKGTSFGTKLEGLDVSRSLSRAVQGLFHVGSVGIIMSGWLGAMNYGVIVANDADAWLRE